VADANDSKKPPQADALSGDLALGKFDGRDRPLAIVAADRDSKAVQFVKPNVFHRPRLSVGEDHGFADKLGLGLLERAENRGRADLRSRHGEPGIMCEAGRCLQPKGAKVVTGARQTGDKDLNF
jgi:hypothetical protein